MSGDIILNNPTIDRLVQKHQGKDADLVHRALLQFKRNADHRRDILRKARQELIESRLSSMMNDTTPYHMRPKTEVERERLCKTFVFSGMPPVKHIFEALGGIGLAGKILAEAQPDARLSAVDLDETCVKEYNKNLAGRGKAVIGNAFNYIIHWNEKDWACSVDFNKYTLINMLNPSSWQTILIDEAISRQPKWVHIGDTASKYLHLNFKSYGLSDGRFESYLASLDQTIYQLWGYRIARLARHNGAAQMVLLPELKAAKWKYKAVDEIEYHWRLGAAPIPR